jgi:membrane associated rhomboid family serine protease
MKLRLVFWTVAMAYAGFLWAGRGVHELNSVSISGAIIGAATGFLLAVIFAQDKKKAGQEYPDACVGSHFATSCKKCL